VATVSRRQCTPAAGSGAAAPSGLTISLHSAEPVAIAPGQLLMLPVVVAHTDPDAPAPVRCKLRLEVRVHATVNTRPAAEQWSNSVALELECRKRRDSFRYTFIDHDGSVAEAAAVAPWGAGAHAANTSLPIVLSLHGTGVSARSQADS
jgi:hypothetical protein